MPADEMKQPTMGELECLAVLWEAQDRGQPGLRLSEVRERVGERRRHFGEPQPALTTVSTFLRGALAKGLVVHVRLSDDGRAIPMSGARTLGGFPTSRSPKTAYQASVSPTRVFREMFQAIIHAYPPKQRNQALIDLASALKLPRQTIKKLEQLIGTREAP